MINHHPRSWHRKHILAMCSIQSRQTFGQCRSIPKRYKSLPISNPPTSICASFTRLNINPKAVTTPRIVAGRDAEQVVSTHPSSTNLCHYSAYRDIRDDTNTSRTTDLRKSRSRISIYSYRNPPSFTRATKAETAMVATSTRPR